MTSFGATPRPVVPPQRRPRRSSLSNKSTKQMPRSTSELSKMTRVLSMWRDLSLKKKNDNRRALKRSLSDKIKKPMVVFRPPTHPIDSDDPEALLHDVYLEECEFDPHEACICITEPNFETLDHHDIPWYEEDYEELPWWEYPDLDEDDELTALCKDVIRESAEREGNRNYTEKWICGHADADRVETLVVSFVLKLQNRVAYLESVKQQQQALEADLKEISLGGENIKGGPAASAGGLDGSGKSNSRRNYLNNNLGGETAAKDEAPIEKTEAKSPPQQPAAPVSSAPVKHDQQAIMHKLLNPSPTKTAPKPKITKADVAKMIVPRRARKTPRRTRSGTSQQSHSVLDDDSVSLHSAAMSTGWNRLNIHNSEMRRYRKSQSHRPGARRSGGGNRNLWADDHTVMIHTKSNDHDDDVQSVASFQSSPAMMEYTRTRQSWMQFNPHRQRKNREPKKLFKLTTSATSTADDSLLQSKSAHAAPRPKKKKKKKKRVGHLAMFMAKEELRGDQSESNIFDIMEEEPEDELPPQPKQRASEPPKKNTGLSLFPAREEEQELNGSDNCLQTNLNESDNCLQAENLNDSENGIQANLEDSDNCIQANLEDSDNCIQSNLEDSDNCIQSNLDDSDNCIQANLDDSDNCIQESNLDDSDNCIQANLDDSDNCIQANLVDEGNQNKLVKAEEERSDDRDKQVGSDSDDESDDEKVCSDTGYDSDSSSSSGSSSNEDEDANNSRDEEDEGEEVKKKGDSSSTLDHSSSSTAPTERISKSTTASSPVSENKIPISPLQQKESAGSAKTTNGDKKADGSMAEWQAAVMKISKGQKSNESRDRANSEPQSGEQPAKTAPASSNVKNPAPTPTKAVPVATKKVFARRASASGTRLFSAQLPSSGPRSAKSATATSSRTSKQKGDSTTTSSSSKNPAPKKQQPKRELVRRASFSDIQFSVPNEKKVEEQKNSSPMTSSMKEDDPKLRLVMLRHAAICTQTQRGAVCPSDPKCSEMKELLRHMMKCKHQSTTVPCNFAGCHESKNLLVMMHKTSQILARQKEVKKDLPPIVAITVSSSQVGAKKGGPPQGSNDDDIACDISDIASLGSASAGESKGDDNDDSGNDLAQAKKSETMDISARSEQMPVITKTLQRRKTWGGGVSPKPVFKDKVLMEKMKKEEEERERTQADLKKRHEAVKARLQAKMQNAQKQKKELDTKVLKEVERRPPDQGAVMQRRLQFEKKDPLVRPQQSKRQFQTNAKQDLAEKKAASSGKEVASKPTKTISPAEQRRLKEQEQLRQKHLELKANMDKSTVEKAENEAAEALKKIKPVQRKSMPATTVKPSFANKPFVKAPQPTTGKILPSNKGRKSMPATTAKPAFVGKSFVKTPEPTSKKILPANTGRGPASGKVPPGNTSIRSGRIPPANAGKGGTRKSLSGKNPVTKTTRKSMTIPLSKKDDTGMPKLDSEIVYGHQIEATSEVERLKAAKLAKKAKKKRASVMF